MSRAYLGLGTNIGDRGANLERAIELLTAGSELTLKARSSIYETMPVGVEGQPKFLNMVIAVETELSPHKLLELGKSVEKAMGRKPGPRWGPRVIDVDLLLYDNVQVQEAELTIPHPRMWQRAFVMVPLAEIAPDLVGPGGLTVGALARQADGDVRQWEGGG